MINWITIFSRTLKRHSWAPGRWGVSLTTSDEALGRRTSWAPGCTGTWPAICSGCTTTVADGGPRKLELYSHSSISSSKNLTSWTLNHPQSSGFHCCRSRIQSVTEPDGKTDKEQYVLGKSSYTRIMWHRWRSRNLTRPDLYSVW